MTVPHRIAASRRRLGARPSGVISILAMVFLVIASALAVSYAALSNGALQQAHNHTTALSARLQAESGLAFLLDKMSSLGIPKGAEGQELLDAVAAGLQGQLDGTANLGGSAVGYNGAAVLIPSIVTDEGSFSATVTPSGSVGMLLSVTGTAGTLARTVSMECSLLAGGSAAFDYGIATGGKVDLTGNARILGANCADEAKVLSTTYADDEAYKLTGNCRIDGDIYASNPAAYVTLIGNTSIGGVSNWDPEIVDHIHIGIGDVELPEVDPNVFEPFATNVVDASTQKTGNLTFENIRIAAGTNPTFAGNITINGVVFVEVPNQVQFSGNVTVTGVIVTQDAGEGAYNSNTIKFTGNTTSRSVSELPDTPPFHDLRDMTGSFLLAPGFGVEFVGNFGTVNGCMAADKFKWTGNAGGTVRGPVISYSDEDFKMTGNANLTIDRSDGTDLPAGFARAAELQPNADTYTEH
jgi:hypothetical protein